jgi:hypothetical protein
MTTTARAITIPGSWTANMPAAAQTAAAEAAKGWTAPEPLDRNSAGGTNGDGRSDLGVHSLALRWEWIISVAVAVADATIRPVNDDL